MDTPQTAPQTVNPAEATPAFAPSPAPVDAAPAARQSVRDKLRAFKEQNSGERSTELPETGLAVTYPAFIGHDRVVAATKMAGKKRDRVGKILVAQLCTFEGEKLTADEIGTELPNADVVHLTNLLFGADASSGEDGDEAGN